MKPLIWVELTRQQIKARHGFGWSIQGIEKQNKVITKIVYRFSTGQRSTVFTSIDWNCIYVLTNPAMPDLVKIVKTTRDVSLRLSDLYTTLVQLPFGCEYTAKVKGVDQTEKAFHLGLKKTE